MSRPERVLGIDIGSSYGKAVLVDREARVLARAVRPTGIDFAGTARALILDLAGPEGVSGQGIAVVATGYGRQQVPSAFRQVTEVTCQALAAWHLFGRPLTLIDIGGQDTKVIEVDPGGRRRSFHLNRKCASGTGAFLEEMAGRLGTDPAGMDRLAEEGVEAATLSSFCTVFAQSELLALARQGRSPGDIALGVFDAVVKRVLEMARPTGEVALTGGAARGVLVHRMERALGRTVLVPDHPQFTGALGAALLALREDPDVPAGEEGSP
ncbi:hypothetical protein KBD49_00185 [Myxococcota bacterium]|nr:hypothetical protein [Myxococcota bacterium]